MPARPASCEPWMVDRIVRSYCHISKKRNELPDLRRIETDEGFPLALKRLTGTHISMSAPGPDMSSRMSLNTHDHTPGLHLI